MWSCEWGLGGFAEIIGGRRRCGGVYDTGLWSYVTDGALAAVERWGGGADSEVWRCGGCEVRR